MIRNRIGIAGLMSALLVALLPMGAVSAAPEDHQPAAEAAAAWIATELEADEPRFDTFGAVGSRADIIFALASSGTQYEAFVTAYGDMAAGAADYVGPEDDLVSSATGKVILAAWVAGYEPDEILEGRDLAAELAATVGVDGAFPDEFGVNVFTQSLALLGLATTEAGVPEIAVDWLIDAQCDDGAFSYSGTCPVAPGSEEPDTTGLAALALLAAGADSEAALAGDWLEANQDTDGSLISSFGANANSTAVGAQALRALGRTEAADAATEFLIGLQLEDGDDAGALKYLTTDAFANAFATLQGVPGLVGGDYLDMTAPEPVGVTFDDVPPDSDFVNEIGWLGAVGITRGCNPPVNDLFCPDDTVTRGQMAAFLVRALGLTDPGSGSFVDTSGSEFEQDILRIEHSGITLGCNPPVNDRFCPDDSVTRGQMAAFLVRAYDLSEPADTGFVDDDQSVFEQDILRLKQSGITLGCNPPVNDRFCPDDSVTRGEMAAFLYRARDL